MIGPRHQDDRGKRVRLHPTGYRGQEPGSWAKFASQAWHRFREAKGLAASSSACALAGVVIVGWLMTRDVVTLVFFSPVGSTLVLMVAVLVLSIGHLWAEWPHWVRDSHLESDRCPACGYDLAGLKSDLDGCVTCPECDAAWNVADAKAKVYDRPIVVVADNHLALDQSAVRSAPPTKTDETTEEPNSYTRAR